MADAGGELEADLLEVRLDLVLDLAQHGVGGRVENVFRGLRERTQRLLLHARGLVIESVRDAHAHELAWTQEGETLRVELAEPLERGAQTSVCVQYSARPEKGLYFVQARDGSPEVWSQNEPSDARAWIPTWDEPNDRASFDARITVGQGLEVLSNGVREEVRENPDGSRTFHWRQERPIPAYLFAVAAGRWIGVHDDEVEPELGFFVPAGTPAGELERTFSQTLDILAFEQELFGEPFPWPRYDQVVVDDFVMGGMENAGLTLLTDEIVHDADEELDEIGERELLLAHEAAHQWFGDLVTCLGWRSLWLNEGWASYVELLYLEHREGGARAALWFERYRELYLARGERTRLPLSESWRAQASEDLCNHEYDKGPWVLRMLEHQLGHADFWCGARHYLAAHKDGFASTEDFGRAFLEATGRNVLPFLQQWVEGAGHPQLRASWSERDGRRVLTLEQRQRTDELVPLFDVPLELELDLADGSTRRQTLRVHEARAEFDLGAADAALLDLVLDPDGMLLCELELDKPAAAWAHQAALAASPSARWRAVGPLSALASTASDAGERRVARDALVRLLHDDEFLLRGRAVAACAGLPALRGVLLAAAREDPVAYVRELAVAHLASEVASPDELESLRPRLELERSPRVRLALERALGVLEAAPGR